LIKQQVMDLKTIFQRYLSFVTLLLLIGISFYQELFLERKYKAKKSKNELEKTMNPNTQKNFPRHRINAPIFLTDSSMAKCYEGKLCNLSGGGANLESGQDIYPGMDIFFQLCDEIESSPVVNLEKEVIVHAEVVWCMEIVNPAIQHYSVGLKFIPSSH